MVASVGAVVIGYLALSRHLLMEVEGSSRQNVRPPGEFAFFSVLLVIFLVVLCKGFLRRGLSLQGGMPSGHTAFAFALFTAIALTSRDPIASVLLLHRGPILSGLSLFLAYLIGQSRVQLGVHSLWEVLVGAVLGSGTTLLLYVIYP